MYLLFSTGILPACLCMVNILLDTRGKIQYSHDADCYVTVFFNAAYIAAFIIPQPGEPGGGL